MLVKTADGDQNINENTDQQLVRNLYYIESNNKQIELLQFQKFSVKLTTVHKNSQYFRQKAMLIFNYQLLIAFGFFIDSLPFIVQNIFASKNTYYFNIIFLNSSNKSYISGTSNK